MTDLDVPRDDGADLRKRRGAFFTPYPIAEYLARWAMRGAGPRRVLDPTCGQGVFLLACARQLAANGVAPDKIAERLYGIDVHAESLEQTSRLLNSAGTAANLLTGDFFEEPAPQEPGARLPVMDAVIGNPPFVRFHAHRGAARERSVMLASRHGVELSGLASSWAATLVHASGFLAPEGRLAMVVPAELFTVDYAEPIRQWLKRRFARVHLVLFEELQFLDASEQVVLLVAGGSGGTESVGLHRVGTGTDLPDLHAFDGDAVPPPATGKWTDLLIPRESHSTFRHVVDEHFVALSAHAQLELGTVTGANRYFTLAEPTRREFALEADRDVIPMLPPGGRGLRGLGFTRQDWQQLRDQQERVWLLWPSDDDPTPALSRYISHGLALGVDQAYKCSVRTPWWRPRVVPAPDLFMSYMSHVTPRLVVNASSTVMVNSTHAVRIHPDRKAEVPVGAFALLALNSVTMLGAELFGRSYGGGVLKMELREAARLPLPRVDALIDGWRRLEPRHDALDAAMRKGWWQDVVAEVDDAVLRDGLGIATRAVDQLREAASALRRRRTRSDDRASIVGS